MEKLTNEQYEQALTTPINDGLIAHDNNVDSSDKALSLRFFRNDGLKRSSR